MKPIRFLALLLIFSLFNASNLFAEEKATTFELQLDPYYSAIGIYNSLTGKPIPLLKGKSETEIYKRLLSKFSSLCESIRYDVGTNLACCPAYNVLWHSAL